LNKKNALFIGDHFYSKSELCLKIGRNFLHLRISLTKILG